MKILQLKIKNPLGEIIQDIYFKKVGVSFIYGDIQIPENLGATINSLGKTLLLKCIDYIFGSKEDPDIIKKEIHNYELEAVILYKEKQYIVRRILGNSEFNVDNVLYTLTEYRDLFGIRRSLYNKQFILKKKSSEISYRSNPSSEDVISYLELLQLSDIIEDIKIIYATQDKIKNLKNNKKDLISFYGDFNVKQIDEEIYFVDKEVDRLSKELEKISEKVKTIEITELNKDIIEEYATKSKKLKNLKIESEKNKLEYERLEDFINNSNKIDISSEHILSIFEKTKQEIPDMVKKTLPEVEAFHKKVYEERKEFLSNKMTSLKLEIDFLEKEIDEISIQINKIGKLISINKVYQESIQLYEKYNSDLQDLKYKQGKLSQVKNIDDNINAEEINLTNSFNEANQIRKSYEVQIQKYRDFIYRITKRIYDNDVNSYFDIKVRPKHLSARPIIFEFTLKGDTGEGVSEVKKNLMDFLVCRYNIYMEMMLQDSACFNGIDPRQVGGMLSELDDIAKDSNKQVIIAINKYQVDEYSDIINTIRANSSIILSEDNKLLKFDF